ncbi:MAG TPA: serine hydrolase [Patescibacteria group bacterium]|nr:serine hydrolase [Patescibacteria group bacterium]
MKLNLYNAIMLVLFLSVLKAPAQNEISPKLAERLQTSLDILREANGIKSVSAAVFIPGQGVWKGASGMSHGKVAIDSNTLFSMGSITKTFMSAEFLKLAEAGQLSLDDTIGMHLPPIPNVNPSVTIRQLLAMKSGLAEYMNGKWWNSMSNQPAKVWGVRQALDTFLTAPVGAPGQDWAYTNTNYALLGLILEAKKKDSVHKILRNDFLTPLGLKNTYMNILEKYPNVLAHNWQIQSQNLVDLAVISKNSIWTSTAPAGGFVSTPEDLVRWGYNLYSGNVISQASLKEAMVFSMPSNYGLGMERFPDNGRTYYGHTGSIIGYVAIMMYDPVDSVCVAVMINQSSNIINLGKGIFNVLRAYQATSVNDIVAQEDIRITPNPAFDNVTFSNLAGNYSLKIVNSLGETVYNGTYNSAELNINTREFANGMYIAVLTSSSRTIKKKLFIQH